MAEMSPPFLASLVSCVLALWPTVTALLRMR